MFRWSTCKYTVVQTALVLYNRDWIHEITIDCVQFAFRNHALVRWDRYLRCFSQLTTTFCSTWRTTASLNNKQTPRTDFLTTDPPLEEDGSSGEGFQKEHLSVFGHSVIIDYQAQDQSGEVCPYPNVLLMLINHITFHVKFHPYVAWLSNVPNRLADQLSQPVAYPSNLAT